jgi:hypothetical protein
MFPAYLVAPAISRKAENIGAAGRLAQNSRSPWRRACLALLRSDLRDAPFALRPSSSGAPVRQSDRLAASATPSANTSKNAALVSRPCRRKKPAWRLNDWCRAKTSSLLAISTNLRTVSLVQLLFERRFPALCIVMFLFCSGQPSLEMVELMASLTKDRVRAHSHWDSSVRTNYSR